VLKTCCKLPWTVKLQGGEGGSTTLGGGEKKNFLLGRLDPGSREKKTDGRAFKNAGGLQPGTEGTAPKKGGLHRKK